MCVTNVTEILVDTSLLIDYLIGQLKPEAEEVIERNSLNISIVTFIETCRHVHKIGKGSQWEKIKDKLVNFRILPIGTSTGELAARLSANQGLSLADSIIYATALSNNMALYTFDNDFRNMKGTVILKQVL